MSALDELGPRLLVERLRLQLSQQAAAGRLGMSREAYAKFERGTALPDADTLFSLAALGFDLEYLRTGRHPEPTAAADGPDVMARIADAVERIAAALEGKRS